jgi:hypothetical protein
VLCDPESNGVHESGVSLTVCDGVAHCEELADADADIVSVGDGERENVADAENVGDSEGDVDSDAALDELAVAASPPAPPADFDADAHDDAAGERDCDAGADGVSDGTVDDDTSALRDAHCEARPVVVAHLLGVDDTVVVFVARAGVVEGGEDAVLDELSEPDCVVVTVVEPVAGPDADAVGERTPLCVGVGCVECEPKAERVSESVDDTVTEMVGATDEVVVERALAEIVTLAVGGARDAESADEAVSESAPLCDRVCAANEGDNDAETDAHNDTLALPDEVPPPTAPPTTPDALPHGVPVVVADAEGVAVELIPPDAEPLAITVVDALRTTEFDGICDDSGDVDADVAPRRDRDASIVGLPVTDERADADAQPLALPLALTHRLPTALRVKLAEAVVDAHTHAVGLCDALPLPHAVADCVDDAVIKPDAGVDCVVHGVVDADGRAFDALAQMLTNGDRELAVLMLAVAHRLPKSLPVELAEMLLGVVGEAAAVRDTDDVVELLSVAL